MPSTASYFIAAVAGEIEAASSRMSTYRRSRILSASASASASVSRRFLIASRTISPLTQVRARSHSQAPPFAHPPVRIPALVPDMGAPKIQNTAFASTLKDASKPIADVLAQFTKPVDDAVEAGSDDIESPLWTAWNDLVAIVGQTSHDEQDRLVEFVKSLQKLPGPRSKKGGGACTVWSQPATWDSLTLLGAVLRDSWNYTPDGPGASANKGLWVNMNAFVARLTTLSQKPDDAFDYSLYAVWAMRDALEDPAPEAPIAHEELIKGAAAWLIYAAPTLKKLSQSGRVFEEKMAKEGQSLLGKDWVGFNEERWALWKDRLAAVKGKSGDAEVQDFVAKALAEADRA
ncbi:hypothetical protein PVAG01_10706 [Phlyctema vagabunda]|uniref:Uncharacterized protein n=1 Tax=Phlyctema vagabunda TaxID=108571 RepID=A0ABR4P3P0_9HELO